MPLLLVVLISFTRYRQGGLDVVVSGYKDEFEELAIAFMDEWGDRTPIAWSNSAFTPPNPPRCWVRFTIINSTATRRTIGTPTQNRATYPGRVVIQVFAPRNGGDIEIRGHADRVAEIFRGFKAQNFRFALPSIVAVDAITGDEWRQINVDCPFQRDVFHA